MSAKILNRSNYVNSTKLYAKYVKHQENMFWAPDSILDGNILVLGNAGPFK